MGLRSSLTKSTLKSFHLEFIFSRDGNQGGDGFWTTKLKFVYEFGEGRFVPCYTYEKPKPVPLGTFHAVVRRKVNDIFSH